MEKEGHGRRATQEGGIMESAVQFPPPPLFPSISAHRGSQGKGKNQDPLSYQSANFLMGRFCLANPACPT